MLPLTPYRLQMGLGKTLMTLCILVGTSQASSAAEKADSNCGGAAPSVVVCPTSVIGHWYDEAKKHFGDSVQVLKYSGSPSQRRKIQGSFRQFVIVIMSYDTVRSDLDFLKQCHFNYGVLDEGHVIKALIFNTPLF